MLRLIASVRASWFLPQMALLGAVRWGGGKALRPPVRRAREGAPTATRKAALPSGLKGVSTAISVHRATRSRPRTPVVVNEENKGKKGGRPTAHVRSSSKDSEKRVVTRKGPTHTHAMQKIKYNKRVAAIAKLWRLQKR
ncbi:hypothetical protein, conserved [Trypanosoma brucei gambiense DAL972]|uniref:Uncharacterized protein n=2 Tax=Trypanosoma brucei TaxID=5691 RepID=D0A3W4_TRYB9|nr:hypothetical protein, conserved [Trypanosoma brucei gambiense DAL972]RHW69198.1 hypothetical protein DPX39_100093800 [Trypanosoma brucei equiperdum]CBH15958.1 hypothetical protein, conserved [Trypanosoma brucei gambiense DAL972]|eukprot:XP_011778222.1 hypothetical protein, conserved [Trypanosoma brucei gambiense DAL972]